MEDDEKLNPVKEVIKCKIIADRTDGKIPYFELLKKMKNKEIDTKNLKIIDDKKNTWTWSDDCGFEYLDVEGNWYGEYKKYLTDEYDELDLVDLLVTIIPVEKQEDTPKFIATQKVIDMLEQLYMDLNMEIDNCQGCMSGLDVAFAELNIYKELVKFLGGDIENHIQELTNKWFEQAREQREKEEKEQTKRDSIIEKLPLPILDLMDLDEGVRNVIWKQNDKLNEICDILISNNLKNNS